MTRGVASIPPFANSFQCFKAKIGRITSPRYRPFPVDLIDSARDIQT